MKTRHAVLAIIAVSLAALCGCKSVETTSAMLHNEHGQYEKAIEMAKAGIAKNPNDAEAHFQLGISYSNTGKMREAFEEFTLAGQIDPKRVSMVENNIKSNWARHYNQGVTEYQGDNSAGAAKEFELATQADPRQIKGWLNLARVYYSSGLDDSTYMEKAYTTVDTLIAKTKEDNEEYPNVLTLSGEVLVRRGMRDEALKIFDKLILEDPANFEVVENIGNQYLTNRDWESAVLFLEMAAAARTKVEAESYETFYNLGVAYHNAEDWGKAIEAYLAALQIQPDNKAGMYNLLYAYYKAERPDDAILLGQEYTTEFPDDPNGWRLLSLAYSKKGMKLKAEEAATRYTEIVRGQ